MKTLFPVILSVAVTMSLSPAVSSAGSTCPTEVAQAKDMLTKKTAVAKADTIQPPRSLAGARQDVVQAPRENQDVQAPRENQDVQAPRENQDVQAPRENQNVQAPRENQNVQAPRTNEEINQAPRSGAGATTTAPASRADVTKAASLVKQAEAACKAGKLTLASEKAKAALAILN